MSVCAYYPLNTDGFRTEYMANVTELRILQGTLKAVYTICKCLSAVMQFILLEKTIQGEIYFCRLVIANVQIGLPIAA